MKRTPFIRRFGIALALTAGSFVTAADISAQVFTPTYMAPNQSSDMGIYISDGPGNFALEGIWRRGMGGFDLGFRAGLVDLDDAAFTIGAELRSPLNISTAPLSVAVTGGLQAIVGEGEAMGLQGGLSVGHTFIADGISLTPYLHPRLAFVNSLGVDDDSDLEVLADLGVDIDLSSGMSLRVALGLSDVGGDLGFGLAWR